MLNKVCQDAMAGILKVRLARLEDAEDILSWRNDAVTRAMSRNTDLVDWVTHVAWFNKTLTNPDRLLFIGILSDQKIGMVRFDRLGDSDAWEVSIAIAPEHRAKGLGKVFLSTSVSHFLSIHPAIKILADVKRCNVASSRVFKSAGFVRCEGGNTEVFKFIFSGKCHE